MISRVLCRLLCASTVGPEIRVATAPANIHPHVAGTTDTSRLVHEHRSIPTDIYGSGHDSLGGSRQREGGSRKVRLPGKFTPTASRTNRRTQARSASLRQA